MSRDNRIWSALDLDPPSTDAPYDQRAIKRAYAKALKRIDQQADPDGFQALRESYELALSAIKASKPTQQSSKPAADISAAQDTKTGLFAETPPEAKADLFAGAPRKASDLFGADPALEDRYPAYASSIETIIDKGSEDDWLRVLADVTEEPLSLRAKVESLIFYKLHRVLLDDASDGQLPASVTPDVVAGFDRNFNWLSDRKALQRQHPDNYQPVMIALVEAQGRTVSSTKVLSQTNWIIAGLIMVAVFVPMRFLLDWLASIGWIS